MNEKKVPCPICGGSGTFVTQTHYQDEIVEQYCSCWRGWLLFQRKANEEMTVEKIPLSEAKPWGIQDNGDYLGRPDGAFSG
ncbi:hypothetical protein KAI56_01660 [Candidatus Parcubacteria bacterium]|nr:hypothetical protein [Candidatus Parcubacteria bacterium]